MLSGRRLGWSAIRYTLNLSSCCADGEAFERKRRAAPVPPSPGELEVFLAQLGGFRC
jgi:hypothetical protein